MAPSVQEVCSLDSGASSATCWSTNSVSPSLREAGVEASGVWVHLAGPGRSAAAPDTHAAAACPIAAAVGPAGPLGCRSAARRRCGGWVPHPTPLSRLFSRAAADTKASTVWAGPAGVGASAPTALVRCLLSLGSPRTRRTPEAALGSAHEEQEAAEDVRCRLSELLRVPEVARTRRDIVAAPQRSERNGGTRTERTCPVMRVARFIACPHQFAFTLRS